MNGRMHALVADITEQASARNMQCRSIRVTAMQQDHGMTPTDRDAARRLESRSMGLSMGGNVFMGLADIAAGILANSSAIPPASPL